MLDADAVIHQLYQTARAIAKDLNQRFGPQGIYSSEWGLISTLKKRGPMSQTALSGYLNIEPPAISKTLLRLEKKALIRRTMGTSRREKIVFLTEVTENLYPEFEKIISSHHRQILSGIRAEDLEMFGSVLERMFLNACRDTEA